MHEIHKLRQQLTSIATLLNPRLVLDADVGVLPGLTRQSERLLAQILLAGFLDQVAMRRPNAPGQARSPGRWRRLFDPWRPMLLMIDRVARAP